MGRITASFSASLAPSRPATSLHRTLGFSIMMAPVRGQLCLHGHHAPNVCRELRQPEPLSLPTKPSTRANPCLLAQRQVWGLPGPSNTTRGPHPTACPSSRSHPLLQLFRNPPADPTATTAPHPLAAPAASSSQGSRPHCHCRSWGEWTWVRSKTSPGVAAGSRQHHRWAGRGPTPPRTPCYHSGTP